MYAEDDIDKTNKRFYYIRICDYHDDLKISLELNRNLLFKFKDGLRLINNVNENSIPMLYTLDLKLHLNKQQQFVVEYDSQEIIIDDYRLKCSCTNARVQKTVQYEENNDIRHSLNENVNEEHIFLFDIHFQSIHSLNPSGRISRNIERKNERTIVYSR